MPDRQPIAAVTSLLGIDAAEVDALVAKGALPEPTRAGYDVLACVRAYGEHMRTLVPKRVSWPEAQRLYEIEDMTIMEIASRVGVTKQAVFDHVRRKGWVRRAEALRAEASALVRAFVERDRAAIEANLATKHELNRDLMALIRKYVDQLAAGERVEIRNTVALRNLTLALKNVEAIDTSIGSLRDRSWQDGTAEQPPLDLPADVDLLELLRSEPGGQLQ
jgi:predicted DNA-binding protein YlxM (UPF0122 family)